MLIHPNRRLVAALTGSVLLVLPACGGAPEAAEPTPAASSPSPTHQESMNGGSMSHSDKQMDDDTAAPSATAGDPFALTRQAASHMPMTADTLATGFDTALDLPGSATSDAASLRAGLTYLLTEHVYLAGIAVDTAYVAGPDSQKFTLAAEALDENTVALADAIGALAGQEKRAVFLQAWRSHIDDFVSYAVAVKQDDQQAKRRALKNLKAYEKVAGKFFAELTGGALPAKAVRATLSEHVDTLTAAIDAFAAGDPSAFGKLKMAAGHMPVTAQALATGIDDALGTKGDPNSKAADARAALNGELTEHVYLAGIGVFTAYAVGADSDAFKAAAATLDENSVELSQAVTSLTDEKTGDAFLESWRSHINDFVAYAVAVGENDQQAEQRALKNLRAYAEQQGRTMQEVTGGVLQADAVQQSFEAHSATLTAAIDALAAALV